MCYTPNMRHKQENYIGLDPARWVERLRIINGDSQFPAGAKALIEETLRELQERLDRTGYQRGVG